MSHGIQKLKERTLLTSIDPSTSRWLFHLPSTSINYEWIRNMEIHQAVGVSGRGPIGEIYRKQLDLCPTYWPLKHPSETPMAADNFQQRHNFLRIIQKITLGVPSVPSSYITDTEMGGHPARLQRWDIMRCWPNDFTRYNTYVFLHLHDIYYTVYIYMYFTKYIRDVYIYIYMYMSCKENYLIGVSVPSPNRGVSVSVKALIIH